MGFELGLFEGENLLWNFEYFTHKVGNKVSYQNCLSPTLAINLATKMHFDLLARNHFVANLLYPKQGYYSCSLVQLGNSACVEQSDENKALGVVGSVKANATVH